MNLTQLAAFDRLVLAVSKGEQIQRSVSGGALGSWTISGGEVVPDGVVRHCLESGMLVESGDGLFGDSQTLLLSDGPIPESSFLKMRFGEKYVVTSRNSKAAINAQSMGYRVVTRPQEAKARQAYADLVRTFERMRKAPTAA